MGRIIVPVLPGYRRLDAVLERFRREFGEDDPQKAIAEYQRGFDAKTAELDELAAVLGPSGSGADTVTGWLAVSVAPSSSVTTSRML